MQWQCAGVLAGLSVTRHCCRVPEIPGDLEGRRPGRPELGEPRKRLAALTDG